MRGCSGKAVYTGVLIGLLTCTLALSPLTALGGSYEDGVLAYSLQDYPAAISAFEKTLKTDPGNVEAVYYMGMAQYKSKQYDNARRSFQMALRMADPYTPMFNNSKRYLSKIETKQLSNIGLSTAPKQQSMMATFSNASLQDGSNYYGYINEQGLANVFDLSRPITVYVASGQNVPGWTPQKEKHALQSAMSAWKHALNNRVTFSMSDNEINADIVVRWYKNDPEVAGLCKGYGWGGKQLQAHVDLYTFHTNGITPFSSADVTSTAVHEFGHALGISGHSPYEEDLMFYTFSPKQTGRLTGRDVKTMQMVYSEKALY